VAQEKKATEAAKKLPKDFREQALMAADARAPEQVAIMNSISGERNKRNEEFGRKDKVATDANKNYESAKKTYEDENKKGPEADKAKLSELENKMNSSEIARNKTNNDRNKAQDDLDKIEKVIGLLPKNIREGLKNSINEDSGKMEMKNVKVGPGYIARRYGFRPNAVMPGKSEAETVLEAAVKAKKDMDDASSGGGSAEKKDSNAGTEKPVGDRK